MNKEEIKAVRERIRWTEKGAYSDYQVSSYYRQDVPKLLDAVDECEERAESHARDFLRRNERIHHLEFEIKQVRQEREELKEKLYQQDKDTIHMAKVKDDIIEQFRQEYDKWKAKAERLELENGHLSRSFKRAMGIPVEGDSNPKISEKEEFD